MGSINAEIGSSITYTAPSEVSSIDTAVIEMWCNGVVRDTLTISFAGKITYTTPQQPPGTDQTITVDNPNPACEYTWELDGGGSLSSYTGLTTTYTAAETNAYCENNGVISLFCNGVLIDTINIAVNIYGTRVYAAYTVNQACRVYENPAFSNYCKPPWYPDPQHPPWFRPVKYFYCDGVLKYEGGSYSCRAHIS